MDSLRWLDRQGVVRLMAMVVMPDPVHLVAAMTRMPLCS
jgi:hypothetical protein